MLKQPSSLFYSPSNLTLSLKSMLKQTMMAMNLITGGDSSSACSSPRLSFSYDLSERNMTQTKEEVDVARLDMSLLSTTEQNCDFNFCVTAGFSESESSPADELFFNGVIIPTLMKEKLNSINCCINNKDEEITSTTTATLVRQEKSQSKSFWRFKRSSSLNCENFSYKRSSSLWSLPLLSRSKSYGSSSNENVKQTQKNSSLNNGKVMNNNNHQNSKVSSSSCQKPPLSKSSSGGGGSHLNNGGRYNSSALNVPPPYITKGTSDLLGFGSLFRSNSKEKKNKK